LEDLIFSLAVFDVDKNAGVASLNPLPNVASTFHQFHKGMHAYCTGQQKYAALRFLM